MQNAAAMSMRDRFSDVYGPVEQSLQGQLVSAFRRGANAIPQRAAREVFKRQEKQAVAFVHLVDCSDVGMIERRKRLALAQKPLPGVLRL